MRSSIRKTLCTNGFSVRIMLLDDYRDAQAFAAGSQDRDATAATHGSNACPVATQEVDVHASIATFTHTGIGAFEPARVFPMRSTMHQCQSRCWTCANVRAATSERRNPQATQIVIGSAATTRLLDEDHLFKRVTESLRPCELHGGERLSLLLLPDDHGRFA